MSTPHIAALVLPRHLLHLDLHNRQPFSQDPKSEAISHSTHHSRTHHRTCNLDQLLHIIGPDCTDSGLSKRCHGGQVLDPHFELASDLEWNGWQVAALQWFVSIATDLICLRRMEQRQKLLRVAEQERSDLHVKVEQTLRTYTLTIDQKILFWR